MYKKYGNINLKKKAIWREVQPSIMCKKCLTTLSFFILARVSCTAGSVDMDLPISLEIFWAFGRKKGSVPKKMVACVFPLSWGNSALAETHRSDHMQSLGMSRDSQGLPSQANDCIV